MGTEILEQLGYVVIPANSPGAALVALATVWPRRSADHRCHHAGDKRAANSPRIAEVRPAIQRLFMSGYPADFIAHRGVLEAGVELPAKAILAE